MVYLRTEDLSLSHLYLGNNCFNSFASNYLNIYPIFKSLLRKQEQLRQNDCDFEYNERITELKDSPKVTPIRVTVL